jgi:aromatic-L-amino-acid decarboxylase
VDAFRRELDEKLDLTEQVVRELEQDENLVVPMTPELTVVVCHSPRGDDTTARILADINRTRRVYLSSTRLDGRYTIRMCVLSHRSHGQHVAEAVEIIRAAAAG